ncbi:MAG: prepilin-type N-terminal cleavage/methylation domain-containing protein [Planctomycetota bacterium]|nr:prepilin-type N-terminal cleavage/methylation domain-containing protein [Planctomycetota bacterium]
MIARTSHLAKARPAALARRRRPRAARGFTFAELMIVVSVVAIAAALITPKLGANDETRLRAAARLLLADIEYAQIESITHAGAPRVVVFNTSTATYYIATAAASGTPITNPVGKIPYSVTFGSRSAATLTGVTISSVSLGGGSQIAFGSYGQMTQSTSASTITLAAGARSITLSVDAGTGEVSVGSLN